MISSGRIESTCNFLSKNTNLVDDSKSSCKLNLDFEKLTSIAKNKNYV